MLFSYQYVPHQMEKMQEFIDFIFFDVWCKAPEGKPFSIELFQANTELSEVMQDFYFADLHYNDNKEEYKKKGKVQPTASKFYTTTLEIYCLFSQLNDSQINQLQQWYKANNDIEKVCANDPTVHIVRYADINVTYPDLSKKLASFFKGLYSDDLLSLAALQKKIGHIKDHYQQFRKVNKGRECPFCGISYMLGVRNTKREAYDHYLPKGIYPFNSINFRNLVPACHHCNSNYKASQNPAFTPKDPVGVIHRRKVFYPYCNSVHRIEITIDLSKLDLSRLASNNDVNHFDVQLTFGPSAINEEIESWKEIYGIEERYQAMCCDSAIYWLEDINICCRRNNSEPEDELRTKKEVSEKFPLEDSNFLRVAFLEECHRLGIWNSSSQ